jgi:Fe-S-cluster containining protein
VRVQWVAIPALDDLKTMSESPTEAEIRDSVIYYTCQRRCYGVPGQAGICCTLGNRDWIMGPITDAKEFLARLNERFGKKHKYDDVFVEYEEGHRLFPERSCWQNPKHFPALRVVMDVEEGYPCQFLANHQCTIQDIKPKICADYLCDHLKHVVSTVTGESA